MADKTPTPTPKTDPEQGGKAPVVEPVKLTAAEAEALAAAARREASEKARAEAQAEIAQARAEAKAAQERLDALTAESERHKAELATLKDDKLTSEQRIAKSVEALSTRVDTLSAEKDAAEQRLVAAQATFELSLYREQKLRESGILLSELVVGESKEQIDTSIQAAKTREAALRESVRADVARELGQKIPETTVSPDDKDSKSSEAPVVSHVDRERLARLPKAEYEAARAELMAEAKRRIPATSRYR